MHLGQMSNFKVLAAVVVFLNNIEIVAAQSGPWVQCQFHVDRSHISKTADSPGGGLTWTGATTCVAGYYCRHEK